MKKDDQAASLDALRERLAEHKRAHDAVGPMLYNHLRAIAADAIASLAYKPDFRASLEAARAGGREALFVIFDGPPGPEAGRFVEVETADGRSVRLGEWKERADGFWSLGPLYAAAPAQPTGWRPIGDTPKAGGAGADIPTTPEPPK